MIAEGYGISWKPPGNNDGDDGGLKVLTVLAGDKLILTWHFLFFSFHRNQFRAVNSNLHYKQSLIQRVQLKPPAQSCRMNASRMSAFPPCQRRPKRSKDPQMATSKPLRNDLMPYDQTSNQSWTAVGIGLNAEPLFIKYWNSVALVMVFLRVLAPSPSRAFVTLAEKYKSVAPRKRSALIAEPLVCTITESETYHNYSESGLPS